MPLEFVLINIVPRTVVSLRSGSLAMYWVPIGLPETTWASLANAVAEREAKRPMVGFRERIVVVVMRCIVLRRRRR